MAFGPDNAFVLKHYQAKPFPSDGCPLKTLCRNYAPYKSTYITYKPTYIYDLHTNLHTNLIVVEFIALNMVRSPYKYSYTLGQRIELGTKTYRVP